MVIFLCGFLVQYIQQIQICTTSIIFKIHLRWASLTYKSELLYDFLQITLLHLYKGASKFHITLFMLDFIEDYQNTTYFFKRVQIGKDVSRNCNINDCNRFLLLHHMVDKMKI
jgi:hypothetical protein